MSTKELFADRVVNIAVTGGLIRIDFASLEELPTKTEEGKYAVRQRVVMPLDGFAGSVRMMEAVLKKLVDDGVLKRQEAPAGAKLSN
jgi:hypothetical protein